MTSDEPLRASHVTVTRARAVGALRAVAATSLMTAAPLVTAIAINGWPPWIAYAWAALAPAAFVAASLLGLSRRREGSLRVEGEHLVVEGLGRPLSIALDDVTELAVVPDLDGGGTLELTQRRGAGVSARVADVSALHAWLDGAALAQRRRVSRFTMGPAWHTWGFYLGYGLLGLVVAPCLVGMFLGALDRVLHGIVGAHVWGGVIHSALAVLCWAWFTGSLARSASPPRLEVGTDGVAIRHVRRDFVRYESLLRVEAGDTLVLHLLDGTRRDVPTSAGLGVDARFARAAAAAIALARERFAASRKPHDFGLLERNGRPVAEWRAALSALLAPSGAFRGVALDREGVLRVLDDPAASPERRVGAVLALAGGDHDALTRVRVAIDGCAHPETREAMEAARDGRLDERAIARLRRSLDAERAQQTAKPGPSDR